MNALQLTQPQHPLQLVEVERPQVTPDTIIVKVHTCGVCHTDLHVVDGELPHPTLPLIPGHEVVGTVVEVGAEVNQHRIGERVGVGWLHQADLTCAYCTEGHENLCEAARWTGYTANGGYAEYVRVPAPFAYPIPDVFTDVEAAPLLCAGVVGYRSIKVSDLQHGERLGIYGFGASGHIVIQVARYWGCEVYVFTRSAEHKALAHELGAVWVGSAHDQPPQPLDRAIIFAPAGWIVPLALAHLRKGGTLCINAIHMSDIPAMPYELLWHERTIRTVANATRADALEFLPLAAQIPVQVATQTFDFRQANQVLERVRQSQINGAAVLQF
ncbi:MAG: zinc-dependent alcohol dehydrogenase family protein [Anaerolineales bacterium]|nr:zinc-dependent alcohol dehydrogenase family protein [Anaerolineales bacterium]